MTAKGTSDSSEPESFEEATHSDNKDNWCCHGVSLGGFWNIIISTFV